MKKQKWPCQFGSAFMREQVDTRLYEINKKTPYAAFRKLWRERHCSEINPYGSESCPYKPEDCSLAYLIVAEKSLSMDKPTGYFRAMARTTGQQRAENKPLARYNPRTDGHETGATDLRAGARTRPGDVLGVRTGQGGQAGRQVLDDRRVADSGSMGVHGPSHRLQSMGSLLRGDGAGSRTQPYRRDEGQTPTDNDGDTGHPVPPPPPGRLGDEPPSGDP